MQAIPEVNTARSWFSGFCDHYSQLFSIILSNVSTRINVLIAKLKSSVAYSNFREIYTSQVQRVYSRTRIQFFSSIQDFLCSSRGVYFETQGHVFLAMLINNDQVEDMLEVHAFLLAIRATSLTQRKTASVSDALTYRSAAVVMMSEMCLGLHLSWFIGSIAHSLFSVQIVDWFLRRICYVPELIEHPVKPSREFSYMVSSVFKHAFFIVPNFNWRF